MAGEATYTEARAWARWLELFTADDLASAMGVAPQLGQRFVTALLWHGICRDTGDVLENGRGPLQIVEYVPLPPGPKEHYTETPPELATPGVYSEAPPRGLPIAMTQGRARTSVAGQWRPGRRQGPGKKKLPSGS